MEYMRKGAKEGSENEASESKRHEATESRLHEKVSKRKVKKMTNSQQQISGKALHFQAKGAKAMNPNSDTSVKGY